MYLLPNASLSSLNAHNYSSAVWDCPSMPGSVALHMLSLLLGILSLPTPIILFSKLFHNQPRQTLLPSPIHCRKYFAGSVLEFLTFTCWHSELAKILVWGVILWILGCLAPSLGSIHQVLENFLSYDSQTVSRYYQMSARCMGVGLSSSWELVLCTFL